MIPKYRAWHIVLKQMCPVIEINFDDCEVVMNLRGASICAHFNEVILMQSPGRKDKNGVEIFDCDFLQIEEHKFRIYYNEYYCAWEGKELIQRFESTLGEMDIENSRIIGNIHVNPGLLEPKA